MARLLGLLAAACVLGGAVAGTAAAPRWEYTLTVKAPAAQYQNAPVTATVPAPPGVRSGVLKEVGGAAVPATITMLRGQVEVTWMLDRLAQGASRRYLLQLDRREPAPLPPGQGVQLKEICGTGPLDPKSGLHGGTTAFYEVSVDGQLFTRLGYQVDAPKPYCWPLLSASGLAVTRAYPMEQVAGETSDHPHHRSLWFTHGDINGVDFWSESPEAGKVVHREFGNYSRTSGPAMARVRSSSDWLAPGRRLVCQDVREITVYRVPGARLLDFVITLQASQGPLRFGDTKEGTFGLRVADTMRLLGGQGHILSSAGLRDRDTWGKQAAWCDYSGPVTGKTVGITVFDHPANLHHPTYWHVRDYGLFAANPFGVHDFTSTQGEPGAYTLPAGQSLTFRYRILVHEGPPDAQALEAQFRQYAQPPVVEVK